MVLFSFARYWCLEKCSISSPISSLLLAAAAGPAKPASPHMSQPSAHSPIRTACAALSLSCRAGAAAHGPAAAAAGSAAQLTSRLPGAAGLTPGLRPHSPRRMLTAARPPAVRPSLGRSPPSQSRRRLLTAIVADPRREPSLPIRPPHPAPSPLATPTLPRRHLLSTKLCAL